MMGYFFDKFFSPSLRNSPVFRALLCSFCLSISLITSFAILHETGLPPNELKNSNPLSNFFEISSVQTTAPIGWPFPIGLPRVTISGITLCNSKPQYFSPTLPNPVCTSSAIKSILCFSRTFLHIFIKLSGISICPPQLIIGSKIIALIFLFAFLAFKINFSNSSKYFFPAPLPLCFPRNSSGIGISNIFFAFPFPPLLLYL